MANVFEFQMQESFLTGYAEYLKQLKAMHPEKTFAVQISVDLLPDGIGYEIRNGPNISVMEVDAQGQSKPVEVTLDPTGDMLYEKSRRVVVTEPTEITADSLARIYIRAQDEAGHWGNVNLKEATDAQFDAWARSKVTVQGEGQSWPEQERVSFANFINTQVQELVMVQERE